MYEVEMKFRLSDSKRLTERLIEEFGVSFGQPVIERDLYFQHPIRNFAHTDEALRLRWANNRLKLTYKGPKIDSTTKTREEIELPLDVSDAISNISEEITTKNIQERWEDWCQLLDRLRFKPVAEVEKERKKAHFDFCGVPVEITHDFLPELGNFVEIEIAADHTCLDSARNTILQLAEHLELGDSVRTSYLGLLLQKRENSQNQK